MTIDYIDTWKEIIQKPSDFYREMSKTGRYFEPIAFAAVSVSIGTFIHLLFTPEKDAARKSIVRHR